MMKFRRTSPSTSCAKRKRMPDALSRAKRMEAFALSPDTNYPEETRQDMLTAAASLRRQFGLPRGPSDVPANPPGVAPPINILGQSVPPAPTSPPAFTPTELANAAARREAERLGALAAQQRQGALPVEPEPIRAEYVAAPADVRPPEPSAPPASPFVMLDPSQLTLDPKRFQYKASDEQGVTGALKGVTRWEPDLASAITAWQGNDGKTYVVNGHQRTDLAKRAQAAGQDVQMPARLFREADGYTPEYMKALGAYQNIAEGSGTAIDAAKILRAKDTIPAGLTLPNLPPRSQLVQDAQGLAKLSDDTFGMVVNDIVPPGYAAHVGNLLTDPAEQLAAMDVLAKAQPPNSNQARMIVEDVRNSGFMRGEQTSLFGIEQMAQTLFAERARILDNAMKTLRRLAGTFRTAVDQEQTLTDAGNRLSREANERGRIDNATLLDVLDREATRRGPVSDALSQAARDLKDGQSINAVASRFLARVREIKQRGEGQSLQPGDPDGRDGHSGTEGEREGQGNEVDQGPTLFERPDDYHPPFYSALERGIESAKQDRAPAGSWKGFIRNLPGIKQEELDWTGVNDWLDQQKGSVSKADLLQAVRENNVQIEETRKGPNYDRDNIATDEQAQRDYGASWNNVVQQISEIDRAMREIQYGQREAAPGEWAALNQQYNALRELQDALHESMVDGTIERMKASGNWDHSSTEWHEYTLPGGENYREMLLRMPFRGAEAMAEAFEAARANDAAAFDFWSAVEELGHDDPKTKAAQENWIRTNRAREAAQAKVDALPKPYRSDHWHEPNVLAHVRFDDRTGPDGEKVLHVAEIQSDWGQAGRKKGYRTGEPSRQRNFADYGKAHGMTDREIVDVWRTDDPRYRAWEEEQRQAAEADAREARAVPDMPFKTSWHELAMKRILRYAAENGYDRVSWDTGDTNADRYDLSKQISRLALVDNSSGGIAPARMDGPFTEGHLMAYDHQGNRIISQNVTAETLADHIGKEAAEKLLKAPPKEDRSSGIGVRRRELTGLDLKVGGEGMRGFYDKILPAFVNKYGKKWGAKVEDSTVPGQTEDDGPLRVASDGSLYWLVSNTHGKVSPYYNTVIAAMEARDRRLTTPVHSVAITPEMRASVMAGQPLFEDPKQLGMPGMEPSAKQAQAARDQAGRGMKTTAKPQKPADEGLFAPKKDETKDLFAAPPNPHDTAAAYVLDRGRQTGHEYMAVVDGNTGDIISRHTDGKPNQVGLSNEVAKRADDPDANLVIHHNHPRDTALSSTDIAVMAWQGIKYVVAHQHTGDMTAATLEARFREILMRKSSFPGLRANIIKGAWRAASQGVTDFLYRAVAKGDIKSEDVKGSANDILLEALHAAGVIDYITTRQPMGFFTPETREQAIRAAAAAAKDYLNAKDISLASDIDRRASPVLKPEGLARLPVKHERGREQGPPAGQGSDQRDRGTPAWPGRQGRLLENPEETRPLRPEQPTTAPEGRDYVDHVADELGAHLGGRGAVPRCLACVPSADARAPPNAARQRECPGRRPSPRRRGPAHSSTRSRRPGRGTGASHGRHRREWRPCRSTSASISEPRTRPIGLRRRDG